MFLNKLINMIKNIKTCKLIILILITTAISLLLVLHQINYVKEKNKQFDLFSESRIEQNFSNNTVSIKGIITEKLALTFLHLDLSNTKTIILDSPGGDVNAAIILAIIIRKKHFNTLVESTGKCASACPLIFQAGVKRIAYKTSVFLYHFASVYVSVINKNNIGYAYNLKASIIETSIMFVIMEKYGLSPRFKETIKINHDYIYLPSQLTKFNIFTEIR